MPTPLPIELSTIGQVSPDLFDCIMCDDPFAFPFDAQRYRGAGDSKRLWMQPFYPFRLLTFADTDAWAEYRSKPTFYFDTLPWGSVGELQNIIPFGWVTHGAGLFGGTWVNNTQPSFQNLGPVIYHQQLATVNLTPYGDFRVMQVLPIEARGYQIWRVTVREPFLSYYPPQGYDGFTPPGDITNVWSLDKPWWASSDWTLVTSGVSTPLVPITIQPSPSNQDPRSGFCQVPPAGTLSDGVTASAVDSDWLGWGIMTFLVWV